MVMKEDLRTEKIFEAFEEGLVQMVGGTLCEECPAVLYIRDFLGNMKSMSNAEIRMELGMIAHKDWKCPMRK